MSKNRSMQDLLDKCDVVLDMDDPHFAEKFREAAGVRPDEPLEIVTPQFERVDGVVPAVPQINFANLPTLADETLRQMGCQKWDEPNAAGETLWLYPAEWYGLIPDGTPIVTISDRRELFKRGETNDDMRYGALAYGFMKKAR